MSLRERVHDLLLERLPDRRARAEDVLRGAAPPFSIYVHVPFCGALCGYCSFNKRREHGEMDRYVDALVREAELWRARPSFARPEVTSVFVGGGTPSYLPAESFARMLRSVLDRFDVDAGVQVTSEANPESIDREKLVAMQGAGVTRLSIGVQTFDEAQLKRIGRRHRGLDVERAVEGARERFDEVSIDLMFGQPEQTMEGFERDLARAAALPITHLSLFPFVYRPDTAVGRRGGAQTRARVFAMFRRAQERLADAGFTPYTSEDYTRTGVPCRYNVDMWEPPPKGTLGLGAGAISGFLPWAWNGLGPVEAYMACVEAGELPVASGWRMTAREAAIEHVLLGLRTLAVQPERFRRATGTPLWRVVGPAPWLAAAAGLLRRRDDGAWVPTERGRFEVACAWTGFVLAQLARAAGDAGDGRFAHAAAPKRARGARGLRPAAPTP